MDDNNIWCKILSIYFSKSFHKILLDFFRKSIKRLHITILKSILSSQICWLFKRELYWSVSSSDARKFSIYSSCSILSIFISLPSCISPMISSKKIRIFWVIGSVCNARFFCNFLSSCKFFSAWDAEIFPIFQENMRSFLAISRRYFWEYIDFFELLKYICYKFFKAATREFPCFWQNWNRCSSWNSIHF